MKMEVDIMGAVETPSEWKIHWDVVLPEGYVLRASTGASRFGHYEIVGDIIRDRRLDVRFTPFGGQAEVFDQGLTKRQAYYACVDHNKDLLRKRGVLP
jgi:hypothetical protein